MKFIAHLYFYLRVPGEEPEGQYTKICQIDLYWI